MSLLYMNVLIGHTASGGSFKEAICKYSYWNKTALPLDICKFVLFIVFAGCRRDVLDHTSCGFVLTIIL